MFFVVGHFQGGTREIFHVLFLIFPLVLFFCLFYVFKVSVFFFLIYIFVFDLCEFMYACTSLYMLSGACVYVNGCCLCRHFSSIRMFHVKKFNISKANDLGFELLS